MAGLTDVIKSEVIPYVSKFAPLLASVLGSPVSGIFITLLGNFLGSDANDLEGLSKVLNDPAQNDFNVKILKKIESDHKVELEKLASTDFSLQVQDTQDARKQAVIFKDFLRHFAYLITVGFFLALFLLFIPLNISGEEKNLLSMLVGMLASKWQTIVDFFFGNHHVNGKN